MDVTDMGDERSSYTRNHQRQRKPLLSPRSPGIENLTADLPCDPEQRDTMRQLAAAITATVSRWQVDKAKRNTLAKGGR